jgi:hypothetical protein
MNLSNNNIVIVLTQIQIIIGIWEEENYIYNFYNLCLNDWKIRW